eukprot:Rhum_TRINITY_DN7118_c0_g1::Rhum_TRINITY_DN7118_c0_g1_i1::g.21824::m.21824/K01754/E4.3.1.19, ilvA, tdcB; threonine dehydratase
MAAATATCRGAPNDAEVIAASRRLWQEPILRRTPLLESTALNTAAGGHRRVLVKAECLQAPGSFKLRGALNRILLMPEAERRRGVVAFSSGNFGRGLAAAAESQGVPCTIVMPQDAPAVKKEGARRFGASVVESPLVAGENREVTANRVAEEHAAATGAALLHPFEDRDVIAGQGSVAVEAYEDLAADGGGGGGDGGNDVVFVIPAGGGGLSAGCNLAIRRLLPGALSYIVEPEHYDDHRRSLLAGDRVSVDAGAPGTICDALQAASPGASTFPINRRLCAGGLAVSDAEVSAAVAAAARATGLVLEPSGATALAAVLAGKLPACCDGKTVVVVASGGDPAAGFDASLARVVG